MLPGGGWAGFCWRWGGSGWAGGCWMSCQDMPWGASCCEYDGTMFSIVWVWEAGCWEGCWELGRGGGGWQRFWFQEPLLFDGGGGSGGGCVWFGCWCCRGWFKLVTILLGLRAQVQWTSKMGKYGMLFSRSLESRDWILEIKCGHFCWHWCVSMLHCMRCSEVL